LRHDPAPAYSILLTLDELAKAILAGPVEDGKRPFEIGPVDRVELYFAMREHRRRPAIIGQ
jgi:hypothetical protein